MHGSPSNSASGSSEVQHRRAGVRDLPVLTKILLVMLVTGVAGIGASVSALSALSGASARTQNLSDDNLVSTAVLGEVDAQVLTVRLQLASIAMSSTEQDRATFKANMDKAATAASDLLKSYTTHAPTRSSPPS